MFVFTHLSRSRYYTIQIYYLSTLRTCLLFHALETMTQTYSIKHKTTIRKQYSYNLHSHWHGYTDNIVVVFLT